jgi:hypothetical protein
VSSRHQRGHPPPLRRQQGGDHQPLALLDVLGDGTVITGEPPVELGHLFLVVPVDEDPVHFAHRVVTRRAGDRPPGRQLLTRLQDLLHRDPRLGGDRAQSVEVAGRIHQAVRVVDPQSGEEVGGPPPDQLMGRREHRGVLGPDPGEGADREEPSVVQLGIAT